MGRSSKLFYHSILAEGKTAQEQIADALIKEKNVKKKSSLFLVLVATTF